MGSNSLLDNRYLNNKIFNKISIANFATFNYIKTFIHENVHKLHKLNIKNNKQNMNFDSNTNNLDVYKEFNIDNQRFMAINTINCFVKTSLHLIEKSEHDTYKIYIKDDYNVTMYTTYTKQQRVYNRSYKVDDITECSNYMVKNGTNAVLSFNNSEFVFLVNIIDGHLKSDDNELVAYIIKPYKNLKISNDTDTSRFENENYFQNDLELPLDLKNVNCNVNINKSIYGGGS